MDTITHLLLAPWLGCLSCTKAMVRILAAKDGGERVIPYDTLTATTLVHTIAGAANNKIWHANGGLSL
jgi:hypothetical protein